MNTSNEINELAAALAKAQGSISAAKFDAQNPHLKNRYTTLAAVWDAIRKPLSDNGLSVVQVVTTDVDSGMTLNTRLMHASGQYIEATYPVNASDGRGVSTAQAVGSALTYARRYSLTALVGVVSDDDDDGNSAGQTQQRQPAQRPQPKPQPQPTNGQAKRIPDGDIVTPTGRTFIAAEDREPANDPPGFETWADWSKPEHAIQWGLSQGVFDHQRHAENAYAKVKAECKPAKASDMWQCWYADVMRRIAEKAQADQPVADDDGWAEIEVNGVEVPLFS